MAVFVQVLGHVVAAANCGSRLCGGLTKVYHDGHDSASKSSAAASGRGPRRRRSPGGKLTKDYDAGYDLLSLDERGGCLGLRLTSVRQVNQGLPRRP